MFAYRSFHAPLMTATLALALLSASACGGVPDVPRDAEPLIQTSALRYVLTQDDLGYRTRLVYTFRNETGGPVYLPNCEGDVRPVLQVDRNGSWFDAWTPFRSTCESPAVVIGAGESRTDTLSLFAAPAGSNVVPTFVFPEVDGVYRLLWDRAVSRYEGGPLDPEALLPVAQRTSNRFVLTR